MVKIIPPSSMIENWKKEGGKRRIRDIIVGYDDDEVNKGNKEGYRR